MERCKTLEEYSIFVSRIAGYIAQKYSLEEAVDTAVAECIEEGILADFLLKHRAEVVGMLLEEFNMEEYIKMERRDSFAEGRIEGKTEALLDILEEKGEIPNELRKRIAEEENPDTVKGWLKIAGKASDIAEFIEKCGM